MILVGDVGGTHTRLALARRAGLGYALDQLEVGPTPASLTARLADYARRCGAPIDAVALCGAGPVAANGRLALTNHPAVLEVHAIAAALNLPPARVRLVNDFEAVADAIPALAPGEHERIAGVESGLVAPHLVLGAGTGLGVATLLPQGADWRVLPGEGGHVDLAPVSDAECAVHARLRKALGPLSAESILCGPGLPRLHAALHVHAPVMTPPQITEAARLGDYEARATLALFARWLGRVAGNAALTMGARGGVWIAGGIVPGLGAAFDTSGFIAGFLDKPAQRRWLGEIPIHIVRHPQPGLLGLARRASA